MLKGRLLKSNRKGGEKMKKLFKIINKLLKQCHNMHPWRGCDDCDNYLYGECPSQNQDWEHVYVAPTILT